MGVAIRGFKTSPTSNEWIRNLQEELQKQKKKIKYGAVFVTHALKKSIASLWGKRFLKTFKQHSGVTNVFPKWLSGQVMAMKEKILKEGVLLEIEKKAEEILAWMSKS